MKHLPTFLMAFQSLNAFPRFLFLLNTVSYKNWPRFRNTCIEIT
mgnify:CR=1 FL=1